MAAHDSWKDADLLLHLRVSPRASRDKVAGMMGDRLKVAITASPVDGHANQHLVAFLAKKFRVAKSQVQLVSGQTGRNKTIRVCEPTQLPEEFQVQFPLA